MHEISKAFHEQYAHLYDQSVRVYLKDGSVQDGIFNDEFYEDSAILLSCEVIPIAEIERMERRNEL